MKFYLFHPMPHMLFKFCMHATNLKFKTDMLHFLGWCSTRLGPWRLPRATLCCVHHTCAALWHCSDRCTFDPSGQMAILRAAFGPFGPKGLFQYYLLVAHYTFWTPCTREHMHAALSGTTFPTHVSRAHGTLQHTHTLHALQITSFTIFVVSHHTNS